MTMSFGKRFYRDYAMSFDKARRAWARKYLADQARKHKSGAAAARALGMPALRFYRLRQRCAAGGTRRMNWLVQGPSVFDRHLRQWSKAYLASAMRRHDTLCAAADDLGIHTNRLRRLLTLYRVGFPTARRAGRRQP